MKPFIIIVFLLAFSIATAKSHGAEYPRAAMAYLGEELPLMEKAISNGDHSFFRERQNKVMQFLESWNSKVNPTPLEQHPYCTEAITDYLIVGLCRVSPPGSLCEPITFFQKFERNVSLCRSASGG